MGFAIVSLETLIIIYCGVRGKEALFKAFVVITFLQNFILIIFSHWFDGSSTTLFILIKELIIYYGAFVYWVSKLYRKDFLLNIIDGVFIIFLLYSTLNIVVNHSNITSAIASLRQFLVPYSCYYFGRYIYRDNNQNQLIAFFLKAMFLLALVSLVIDLFDPKQFWESLGFKQYQFNKTGSNIYSSTDSFYSYDLGGKLRRLTSLLADPLAYAHLIAIAILLFLTRKRRDIWMVLVFFGSAILCFSKFHIVLIMILMYLTALRKTKTKWIRNLLTIGLMAAVLFGYKYLTDYTTNLSANTATGNHFSALQNGLANMSLFGSGLGTSGFNSLLYGDSATTATNGIDTSTIESFFATLLSQVGLLGTAIYYGGIIYMTNKLKKVFSKTDDNVFYACFIILFSIVVESLISASSISMLGSGIAFVFTGLLEQSYRSNQLIKCEQFL